MHVFQVCYTEVPYSGSVVCGSKRGDDTDPGLCRLSVDKDMMPCVADWLHTDTHGRQLVWPLLFPSILETFIPLLVFLSTVSLPFEAVSYIQHYTLCFVSSRAWHNILP